MGQDTVFIARGREQERALSAVTTGQGVAIVGAAGMGKTALATSMAEHLDSSAFAVVWTTATRAAQQVPFGVFAGLLRGEDEIHPALVPDRVATKLLRRAGDRIPVLVLDDAHLMDEPSAGVALTLAGGGDLRLVVTARSEDPVPDAVVALWKDKYLHRVDVTPFRRCDTAQLLRTLLTGEVAGPMVELLHQWSDGNPLFLAELVRHGRATRQIVHEGGLWWWRSGTAEPPCLPELFTHRLTGPEQDIVTAAAIGGPLPLSIVDTFDPATVESLEERRILTTAPEEGLVRLTQPLLGAAIRQSTSGARRRRVAQTMLSTMDFDGHDIVTTARWHLEAGTCVDPAVLLHACASVQHVDPELAVRLARRALNVTGAVEASIALARSLVEYGESADARTVLESARDSAHTEADQRKSVLALAEFQCWVDRDPGGALQALRTLRHEDVDELTSLILLFAGRTAEALSVAARTKAGRAPLATAVALTLRGRTTEAIALARRKAAETGHGTAIAALALANVWGVGVSDIPLSDPVLGRWPSGPAVPGGELKPMPWTLLDGHIRWVRGERQRPIDRLREAVVQQSAGWRWFHAEATAWLAISLAEDGRPGEAEQVTVHSDPIGLVPGLRLKALAAIAAARGDLTAAGNHIESAIVSARKAGCPAVELDYLTEAAYLHQPVAGELTRVLQQVDGPRLIASGSAALALTRWDGAELLHHAIELDRLGLCRLSWRTAEAAAAILKRRHHPRAAEAIVLVARLREVLRREAPADAPRGLTTRETQVAALAAGGMSDREISGRLSLSVRTVESHLARVYHKLGVHSRHELPRDLGWVIAQ
jgi:DNA-binding NarL/FixJ family response regulator